MPKSSRHRSHRHSKHSSKDAKEYSESEEDAKMRDIKEGLAKVPRSSGLSEKRKDHPGYSNGDVAEQHVGSKRRKEKEKGDANGVFDRWNNAEVVESVIKGESSRVDGERTSKSKSILESKSKSSSRVHDSGSEKKEERKEGSKVETKRKYEKELERKVLQHSKDPKESKEKVKIVEKERKVNDREREVEDEVVDIGDAVIPSLAFGKEHEGRHGNANNVWPVQGERNLELEKELEKRSRIRHGSNEKEKYQDDVKVSGDRRVSLREEPAKDGKYRGDKYLVGSHGDKHRDDGDRETRYKDDNYAEDIDKEGRYGDANYRERSEVRRYKDDKDRGDVDRDKKLRDDKYSEGGNKHRDAKYLDDADKDYRRKVDRYHEDGDHREGGDKDDKHRDAKYREDTDKDYRRRVDKYHEGDYREGSDKDNKHTDAIYDEEADKEYRRRVDKYHEGVDRDDKYKDDKYRDDRYFKDISRGRKNREERNWEDAFRDGRGREGKRRDDGVKDKRLRDIKYLDERLSKDGTNDIPDKRSRDESEVAEFRQKRLTNPDGSPNFDDWSNKYKDDRGKRRATDKEDYDDNRFSVKRQQLDLEKKSAGTRVESVGNRAGSSLRDGDMVVNPNHGRRGNSPTRRPFKHEESRLRDYANGRRERRDVTPGKECAGVSGVTEKISHLNDKSLQKVDGRGEDASSERRLTDDVPIPSFQRVDKSLSSASHDRRNLSGQRTGSSKETKDYYGRDNRGNRELPIENFHRDEISQPDADNFSASSPYTKSSNFNNNNKSLLPPTPFRSGPDRPFNDENRNKPNQRRRMDPNIGRMQGNAWRGVPNWPPPVVNGFIPFPHGPPPLNFHPVMSQFPTPPMFMRPSMEMNQTGVPFHLHDSDRFPGHGHPLGWDGNNPIFGDASHMYGRLDWDHSRSFNSGQGWETSRDMWKGQNSVASAEVSASPLKDDPLVGGPGEEDWAGKPAPQTDKEQPSIKVESTDTEHSTDVVNRDVVEASKAIAEDISHSKIRDDDYFARAYLSMLDISEDLSQYELYSQYTNLVVVDQNANDKEDDSRLLIMQEDIDAFGKDSSKTLSASLFPTIDDSIFQRVMSQYKKLKEVVMSMGQDKVPPSLTAEETEPVLPIDPMEADLNHEHRKEAQIPVSDISKIKVEACVGIRGNKIDEQMMTNDEVKPSEPIAAFIKVKMEIDPVEETADNIAEDGSLSLMEVNTYSTNNTAYSGDNLKNGKFVSPYVGASAEVGFEGVIESESVNLSRIHLPPESTH